MFVSLHQGFTSSSAILLGIICSLSSCFSDGIFLPTTGVTAEAWNTPRRGFKLGQGGKRSWFEIPKLMPIKPTARPPCILPVLIMFITIAVGQWASVLWRVDWVESYRQRTVRRRHLRRLGSSFAALGVLPNTSFKPERRSGCNDQGGQPLCHLYPVQSSSSYVRSVSEAGCFHGFHHAAVGSGRRCRHGMFSSIVISGIQLIESRCPRSLSIVSVALGVGYEWAPTPAFWLMRHRYPADFR